MKGQQKKVFCLNSSDTFTSLPSLFWVTDIPSFYTPWGSHIIIWILELDNRFIIFVIIFHLSFFILQWCNGSDEKYYKLNFSTSSNWVRFRSWVFMLHIVWGKWNTFKKWKLENEAAFSLCYVTIFLSIKRPSKTYFHGCS